MYKKIEKLIIYLTFIWLLLCFYMAFDSIWLARNINLWQARWIEDGKFYPVITAGLLFIPPMLVLLPFKLFIKKK